jgi:hypothetical protein
MSFDHELVSMFVSRCIRKGQVRGTKRVTPQTKFLAAERLAP